MRRGVLAITPILTKHQSKLKQDWEEVVFLIAKKERQLNQTVHALSDCDLEGLSEAVKAPLFDGNSAFRKAYLQLFSNMLMWVMRSGYQGPIWRSCKR
jgi:hypothetical protein